MLINTKPTKENRTPIAVYLDKSIIEQFVLNGKSRSVYLRCIINDYFDPKRANPISDIIKDMAKQHYMDVAREHFKTTYKEGKHPENTIEIPKSLIEGVKRFGYTDARKFIDDSIKHYASALEHQPQDSNPNTVYRF
ncbi:MAG: hypothetical protein HRU38_20725 [Saccharospirillaceae bacterium]|nr:hypothetical protein [Saccharospirillaceae bacterium]